MRNILLQLVNASNGKRFDIGWVNQEVAYTITWDIMSQIKRTSRGLRHIGDPKIFDALNMNYGHKIQVLAKEMEVGVWGNYYDNPPTEDNPLREVLLCEFVLVVQEPHITPSVAITSAPNFLALERLQKIVMAGGIELRKA